MNRSEMLTTRMTQAEKQRLDKLAKERGLSRSDVIRQLVEREARGERVKDAD